MEAGTATTRTAARARVRTVVADYFDMMKPRVQSLLLFTTITTMYVAGSPSIGLILATCLGGYLSAGGAGAVNHWYDRDLDAGMARTANRPVPSGRVSPRAALTFGITLGIAAFALMSLTVNLLAAVLSLCGLLGYVFVYTIWLKRRHPQNIVIGGAAGAVPVLVGWAAVQNQLGWAPVLLFAIIFAWTPPHFWALAIKYRDEYASVDVPMMPVTASHASVSRQITLYTVALWAISLVFAPVAHMGVIYIVAATLLGAAFLWYSVALQRDGSTVRAMRLFHYSITYVTLLFAAMPVDQLIRGH